MEASDFLLREIQEKDNHQVAELILKVMTEYDCIGPQYSSSDEEVHYMYETYLAPRSKFFVISRDDKVYGCGGIAHLAGEDERICELRKMYFYPEIRGLGLGSKLLRRCLDEARAFNYTQCYLETVLRMEEASRLYLKYGFNPINEPMGTKAHGGCDAQYMLYL